MTGTDRYTPLSHNGSHKDTDSANFALNNETSVKVMGIINVNEESFYSPSRHIREDDFRKTFQQMAEDGAQIIDIGACSTRPGSTPVSEEQEWEYLKAPLKAIAEIRASLNPEISIDTFRSGIVRKAYELIGPFIVNDISAGEDDSQMLATVSEMGLTYIAMHKRGTPDTMQSLTDYPDGVVKEVRRYFEDFAEKADKAGITNWILDPGFGFAKTIEQNYQLLEHIDELTNITRAGNPDCKANPRQEKAGLIPVLVGISRKSMIYKLLGITPEESLPATCVLNLRALQKGASILRVHDVKEAVQTVRLFNKMSGSSIL